MKRSSSRAGRLPALAVRGVLAILFAGTGVLQIFGHSLGNVVAPVHPGFEPWVPMLTGALQLAGGTMLLLPRGELPAALLLAPFLLVIVSGVLQNGAVVGALATVLLGLLLAVTVAALRQEAREASELPDLGMRPAG